MITHVHLDLNLLLKAVETVKLVQRELLRRYRFFSSSVFSPDNSACTEGGVGENTQRSYVLRNKNSALGKKTHSISYACMCEQAAALSAPGTGSHPVASLHCKGEQVVSLHNLQFQIACYL